MKSIKLPMALIVGISIGAAVVFLSARSISGYWPLPLFIVCPIAMIGMMLMMRDDRSAAGTLANSGRPAVSYGSSGFRGSRLSLRRRFSSLQRTQRGTHTHE
jgi:hypothetical protein